MKESEIPYEEQVINMLHEGEIKPAAFQQLLLQSQKLRELWEHYKILVKALQDEDFNKLLRNMGINL